MQDIFSFIIHPMELGLTWLAVGVGNAGIGIILFTLFIRLVLSPLQITQLRSSRSMQRLQPMIADLRKKHGKDRVALQQATMELYKEHNVNPAMGCLPTIVQFPILIGLFYALMHLGSTLPARNKFPDKCGSWVVHNSTQWYAHCYAVSGVSKTVHVYDLFHAQFLWLSNGLGQPDPLFILPILAGVTQWIQSRMMLTNSTDPQQQMMNNMMNFVPFMIVFFALRYASGLSLYWVTSTLIAIVIQYQITGLGLLPRPAALLSRLGSSGRTPTRRPTPTKSDRPASKRASGQAGAASPTTMPEAPADAIMDGQNGKGTVNGVPPGGRPARRKTNRPKGGGRGGRRG
ncbi:MAG TPA: YidC/Oxa1 family membrane protein insertase [Chloroflexota bacterium]